MNKNGTLFDSGISKLTYYNKIPRTSDLLKSAEFSISSSTNLLISNFYIAPATIRFDNMVEEAIFELNLAVTKQMRTPSEEDVLDLSILENIKKYKSKAANEFQELLQREGHTGELVKVASSLNASALDQFTRAILSEEGIFFYLAYRAIKGFDIEDAEGITSNILESLGLVKSYINVKLIDKVIVNENLSVSKKEVSKLKNAIRNTQISYFEGNPKKTIVKLVSDLKSGGSLYTLVIDFLNSGKVTLARNTNKEALAQKMVDYLIRIGYNEDIEQEENHPKDPQNNGNDDGSDNLESIEGVGKVTKEKFIEAGIKTFAHLAKYDVAGLKKRLKNPQVHIKYNDIIKQAKLISEGRFSDLLELQKKLNKRQ